jgi:glutamine synthetase
LRVCPVFAAQDADEAARQYNVEFRPADATASPYLALGVIVFAGVDRLIRKLELPPENKSSERDMHSETRTGKPMTEADGAWRLPSSLDEALEALEGTPAAFDWLGKAHLDAYLRAKRAEAANARGLEPAELCRRYAEAF